MVELGNFFFKYRNALFPMIFLVALATGLPTAPFGRPELEPFLDVLGTGIALLGQALRILTIGYEYIVRGGQNRQVYADKLVQGGVFSHCRNPLYVGNILIALGLALVIHSFVFYVLFIPFILIAYIAIVAAEERYLRNKFGDEYDDYCHRVNRWIPNWSGYSNSVKNMRFNWSRVLIKEYNTTFALLAALVCLDMWSDYAVFGPEVLPPTNNFIGAIAAWVLLYVFVRTLKKRGYVRG